LLLCYCRRKRRRGRLLYDKIKYYCALRANATERCCASHERYYDIIISNISTVILYYYYHFVDYSRRRRHTPTCLYFLWIFARTLQKFLGDEKIVQARGWCGEGEVVAGRMSVKRGVGERSSIIVCTHNTGTSAVGLATEKGRGPNTINHSEYYAVVYLKTNKEKHTHTNVRAKFLVSLYCKRAFNLWVLHQIYN